MALVVVLVFFVLVILSKFGESQYCPAYQESTRWFRVHWTPTHIFSIRVYANINWAVDTCSGADQSFVSLRIRHRSGTEDLRDWFTPADVKGRFCATFDACRIAKAVQGLYITSAEVSMTTTIFAFKNFRPDQKPASIFISGMALNRNSIGIRRDVSHGLLSVLCFVPNCVIKSGSHSGEAKYYFAIGKKDQAPICLNGRSTTGAAFSITQFLCDPRCTRDYTWY